MLREMRPSRVLRLLRGGGTAISIKLNLSDARAAELAALCGVDCIWLDMEHTANDWSAIEHQIMAAKIHDVDSVVRVSKGSYSDYVRPLELDAAGIMVPHLTSASEAKAVVQSTRFHPVGLRPLDGGNADGSYGLLEMPRYLARANCERMTIVQIEDVTAVEQAEAIAAVEGVDMLFFGPGDFSQSIGFPGQLDHPDVVAARALVARAAAAHGKFAGTVTGGTSVAEVVSMGYRFVNVMSDVTALADVFRDAVGKARDASDLLGQISA